MTLREELAQRGNPLINGNTVTLAWLGDKAPHLVSDLREWRENPQPLAQVEPGVWAVSFDLPEKAYLEYAFYDPAAETTLRDPFNHRTVNNGMGGRNHFFYMPGGAATPLTRAPKGGLRGKISQHRVAARYLTTSRERAVFLYHPPTPQPTPLLVVYDGLDYFKRGKLAEIVENLMAAQCIQPLALAFLENAGDAGRMVEYGESAPTLEFLLARVLPLAARELNLLDQPGAHAVLGASMSGLMSVFTALSLPHFFGKSLSQAGAFEIWGREMLTMQMVRLFPKPSVKLWLDCGQLDSLLPANRHFCDLLTEKGYTFGYRETPGAHNYTTWRNSVAEGLEYLFG